jgi:hypothetical protein
MQGPAACLPGFGEAAELRQLSADGLAGDIGELEEALAGLLGQREGELEVARRRRLELAAQALLAHAPDQGAAWCRAPARALAGLAIDAALREPLRELLAAISGGALGGLAKHAVERICDKHGTRDEASEMMEELELLRWASLLEVVSVGCPMVLHPHLGGLAAWLHPRMANELDEKHQQWISQICRALTNSIPSWGVSPGAPLSSSEREAMGCLEAALFSSVVDRPPRSFAALLDRTRPWFIHSVVRLLCVSALHVSGGALMLQDRVACLVEFLAEAARESSALDVHSQAILCHKAWILCALLEGLGLACPSAPPSRGLGIDVLAQALSRLILDGPITVRPPLLPCIMILAYSNSELLPNHPCLRQALRMGLLSQSKALRSRTMAALAWFVRARVDSSASAQGACGSGGDVHCVAALVPEILEIDGGD